MLLLAIAGPGSLLLMTAEFYLMTRIGGNPATWRTSLEVTVYTVAANLLPLPGGVIARVTAMKAHGTSVGRSSLVVLLFIGIWGGLSFCWSGVALVFVDYVRLGAAATALGLALLCASGLVVAHLRASRTLCLAVVVTRLAMLTLEVLRMMIAVRVLGSSIDFSGASVFVISTFLGIAIMIVPGGLGVREGVVALLSPLVSLDSAIGFLAVAVDRLARMIGVLGLAALMLLRTKPAEQL
jgi:hypothetical protein